MYFVDEKNLAPPPPIMPPPEKPNMPLEEIKKDDELIEKAAPEDLEAGQLQVEEPTTK